MAAGSRSSTAAVKQSPSPAARGDYLPRELQNLLAQEMVGDVNEQEGNESDEVGEFLVGKLKYDYQVLISSHFCLPKVYYPCQYLIEIFNDI